MELIKYKIAFAGESCVGKTCLINYIVHDKTMLTNVPSTSINKSIKKIEYNGNNYLLNLYDTCGQKDFEQLSSNSYEGSAVVVLVFDLFSQDSFEKLPILIESIRKRASPKIPIILVGNKEDLNRTEKEELVEKEKEELVDKGKKRKMVPMDQINEFIDKNELYSYLITSAKEGTNIEELTMTIIKVAVESGAAPIKSPETTEIKKEDEEKEKKSCCCCCFCFRKKATDEIKSTVTESLIA